MVQVTRKAINYRREAEHMQFLRDLSSRLLKPLLVELGSEAARVDCIFVEPKVHGMYGEQNSSSPDMIVLYRDTKYRLLLLEAKSVHSVTGLDRLEYQLTNLHGCLNADKTLHPNLAAFLTQQKVSREIFDACSIKIVGVYRTRQGGFRIYHQETLR